MPPNMSTSMGEDTQSGRPLAANATQYGADLRGKGSITFSFMKL